MASSNLYTVDRFEDNGWVVLEQPDGVTFNVPAAWLPAEAQEGHVLSLTVQLGTKTSTLDLAIEVEATKRRLEEARLQRDALPRGPEGDIEL